MKPPQKHRCQDVKGGTNTTHTSNNIICPRSVTVNILRSLPGFLLPLTLCRLVQKRQCLWIGSILVLQETNETSHTVTQHLNLLVNFDNGN
jgi:hypothetical protein